MLKLLKSIVPQPVTMALSRLLAARWFNWLYFRIMDLETSTIKRLNPGKDFFEFTFREHTVVGNVRFSAGTNDTTVYEIIDKAINKLQISKGDILVDIGANIGLTSIVMAHHAKSVGAQVYGFEPGEQIKYYRKNIELLALQETVQPFELALHSASGTLQIYTYHESIVDSRIYNDPDWAKLRDARKIRRKDVAAIAFDDFCQERGLSLEAVRFVKIDCQGAEPHILKGLFRNGPPRKDMGLLCEFWPFSILKQGLRPSEFLRDFHAKFQGFYFYCFRHDGALEPLSDEDLLRLDQTIGNGENLFCDILALGFPLSPEGCGQ